MGKRRKLLKVQEVGVSWKYNYTITPGGVKNELLGRK